MATGRQFDFLLVGLRDPSTDEVLAAGTVETYTAAGTFATGKVAYKTSSTTGANWGASILLDAYGRAQAWGDGSYDFIVKNSAGTVVYTLEGYDGTYSVTGAANKLDAASPTLTSGNLNMNTTGKIVNLANGTAATDAVAFGQLGNSASKNVGTTAGTVAAGDRVYATYTTGSGSASNTTCTIAFGLDGVGSSATGLLVNGTTTAQSGDASLIYVFNIAKAAGSSTYGICASVLWVDATTANDNQVLAANGSDTKGGGTGISLTVGGLTTTIQIGASTTSVLNVVFTCSSSVVWVGAGNAQVYT